jgi:hypothetical protein
VHDSNSDDIVSHPNGKAHLPWRQESRKLRRDRMPPGSGAATGSAMVNRRTAPSGVDDNLTGRSAEQCLQTIQDVAAEDAFVTREVRVEPTGVLLSVKKHPDEEQ